MENEDKGLIIWRMNGNVLIHIWDSKNKKWFYPQGMENTQNLHTKSDYEEAIEDSNKIQQAGKIYFLTN